MNILSLFDGMSCFQIALQKLGIKPKKYFASEIDKFAIQVTMHNFPDTIQLGNVVDIDTSNLPKIDFLAGGSPCQSFSFAGKRKGMITACEVEILTLDHYLQLKKDGYEFEGQSYLFWEYMRILTDLRKVNPNILFLLENVEMSSKWETTLSRAIGCNPIKINSALVSAQNRVRNYWTNINQKPQGLFGDLVTDIPQPKDKKLLLKHILEKDVAKKYYLNEKTLAKLKIDKINYTGFVGFEAVGKEVGKAATLMQRDYKGMSNQGMNVVNESANVDENFDNQNSLFVKIDKQGNIKGNQQKASCFCAGGNSGGNHSDVDLIVEINDATCGAIRGRGDDNNQELELRKDEKTNSLTTVQKDNVVVENEFGAIKFGRTDEAKELRKESMKNGIDHTPFAAKEITGIDYEKMNCLTTNANKDNLIMQINPSCESNGCQPFQQNRVYDANGISPALAAQLSTGSYNILESDIEDNCNILQRPRGFNNGGEKAINGKTPTLTGVHWEQNNYLQSKSKIRRLTPTECERLQTVPDNYTAIVSDTQRYRMLGNGWNVDTIVHIISFAKIKSD